MKFNLFAAKNKTAKLVEEEQSITVDSVHDSASIDVHCEEQSINTNESASQNLEIIDVTVAESDLINSKFSVSTFDACESRLQGVEVVDSQEGRITPVKTSDGVFKSMFNVTRAVTKEIKSPRHSGNLTIAPKTPTVLHMPINSDLEECASVCSSMSRRTVKERFVLQPLKMTDWVDEDLSHVVLKDILQMPAMYPPQEIRLTEPSTRNRKRKREPSKIEENMSPEQQKSNGGFRIDAEGNIVRDIPSNYEGPKIDDSDVIQHERQAPTYGMYCRRRLSGRRWSPAETSNFYLALQAVGMNFYAMETIFAERSRNDLKKKFKTEEKNNPELVKYALDNSRPCDLLRTKFASHIKLKSVKRRQTEIKSLSNVSQSDCGRRHSLSSTIDFVVAGGGGGDNCRVDYNDNDDSLTVSCQ